MNQKIEQYLRIFVNHRQDDWSEWLSLAQFAYNDKIHSSTGYSPFYLNSGFHPWKGAEVRKEVNNQSAEVFVKQMDRIQTDAGAALKRAQEDMKRAYDRHRKDSVAYKSGDKVWLEGTNITTQRPAKRLDDKRHGPFAVQKKVGESSYNLKLPKTWNPIHPTFNETLLTPYHKPAFPSQSTATRPPPVLVEGHPEYEIEAIQDSRVRRHRLEYLVKWKGYPNSERTWEPASGLTNELAKKMVVEFHRAHPSAPRPMTQSLRFVKLENFTVPTNIPRRLFNWENGKFDPVTATVDSRLKERVMS